MNMRIPSAISATPSLGAVPVPPLTSATGMENPYGLPSAAPAPAAPGMGAAPPAPQPAPPMPPQAMGQPPMAAPSLASPTYGPNPFGIHPEINLHHLVDQLLSGLRGAESSNNYKAMNKKSSASGAYQYTDPTWGKYAGFDRAMDAPPEVQDERMRKDLLNNLYRYGGDPFKAVAHHYYPAYAGDLSKWNQIPVDRYGKEIQGAETPSRYVGKILGPERVAVYLKLHGGRG